jgi:hypothetical protein
LIDMVPLTVPEQDRRIIQRSFWFLISAGAGVVTGIIGWVLHIAPLICALLGFVAVGSLAFANEQLLRKLYHAWNNRIIRPLSNIATAIILRICHIMIFTATGRTGSRLRLGKNGATLWAERDRGANHTTTLPFPINAAASAPNGWIRMYLRWAVHTRNVWAVFLIPFFCLLRMVSTEEPAAAAGNIYTLF